MTWAFLTKAGGETDVIEELLPLVTAVRRAEGLVTTERRPRLPTGDHSPLAFARQAMEVVVPRASLEADALVPRVSAMVRERLERRPEAWHLQVVAPDSQNPTDPRKRVAGAIASALTQGLENELGPTVMSHRVESPAEAHWLVQVWVADSARGLVGITRTSDALSPYPAGRVALSRDQDSPSRSGLKLEEAIEWVGLGPQAGDLCADLGAAPGGWSKLTVDRGAKVIAVDPARLKVELPKKRLVHIQSSAFDYAPPETLDWLLCDMAWRPLEVAKLIGKWGRRAWAHQLIANFKLPMKKKAAILREILQILEAAGWKGLRARQLYFDRDEVTVFGWLDPSLAKRGALAPFELRAAAKHRRRSEGAGPVDSRSGDRPTKRPRAKPKAKSRTKRQAETGRPSVKAASSSVKSTPSRSKTRGSRR